VGRRLRRKLQPLVEAMKSSLLTRPVLHADETPVPMLKPGLGRTHRAYLWSYSTSEYDELQAVIYDFADGRGGVHAREFLGTGKESSSATTTRATRRCSNAA
jgi:transposase